MPRQNRVTPAGDIVATPTRGTLMGNRGCLHDADGAVVRQWARPAWVACRLEWKGIRRQLMAPGKYTELFFLDEATALAAGHRPCNDCRRPELLRFLQTAGVARTAALDERLGHDRTAPGKRKRTFAARWSELPDGVIVITDASAAPILKWNGSAWTWSLPGYDRSAPPDEGSLEVLTPAITVSALRNGYTPAVHASAGA